MLTSNPLCWPWIYWNQYLRGMEAKLRGDPREPKDCHGFCFHYSYEGGAWFDGYEGKEMHDLDHCSSCSVPFAGAKPIGEDRIVRPGMDTTKRIAGWDKGNKRYGMLCVACFKKYGGDFGYLSTWENGQWSSFTRYLRAPLLTFLGSAVAT